MIDIAAFFEKRWVRTLSLILAVVGTAISFLCGYLYMYGKQDGWYNGEEFGFEDSRLCRTYINDCLDYVYRNIKWKSDPTLDTLSSYGGSSFSYTIRRWDGEITADTTTDSSVYVMDYTDDYLVLYSEAAEVDDAISNYALYDYNTVVTAATEEAAEEYIELPSAGPDESPGTDTEEASSELFGVVNADDYIATPYTISGYVNYPISQYDGCYAEYAVFTIIYAGHSYYLPGLIAGTLTALLTMVSALAGTIIAGKNKQKLSKICQLPFDITAVALYFAARLLYRLTIYFHPVSEAIFLLEQGFGREYRMIFYIYMLLAGEILVYMLISQIAGRVLLRRSALYNIIRRLLTPEIMRPCFIVIISVQCIFFYFYYHYGFEFPGLNFYRILCIVIITADALLLLLCSQWLKSSKIVQKASAALASGDLTYKTNTKKLHFIWKSLGQELNSIGDGMALAVEDRMRSERLKTELITNVSHDLKTPVTSIINYLDLMKDEDLTDEKRREYEAILERHAAKLKKLTEDVIEASKAVSGAMKVNWEELDITELLDKSVGEYSERLQEVGIEPVISKPRDSVLIQADGRLLGRVLDNLITNILKYAQQGTRAYFDLILHEDEPELTVKNISRDPLNIPVEELLERFVRGDRSRSSEGSGLGLSIATSLMKLMGGGSLHLALDGDLFKAIITFQGPAKIVREEEPLVLPEPQVVLETEEEERPAPLPPEQEA